MRNKKKNKHSLNIISSAETSRGFGVVHFLDDYGKDCSIQISSDVEPHIWLGVHNPAPQIMYKDAHRLGIVPSDAPTVGWYEIPLPEEAFIGSRMHLNREQALELGKILIKYAKKEKIQL